MKIEKSETNNLEFTDLTISFVQDIYRQNLEKLHERSFRKKKRISNTQNF